MSKKSNKVKFGLKNCHYAKATFDEDGSVTYAKPVRIPGAVSLSMDANGEIEPFYADNIAYYVVNNNSGYEGDLEIALIPESFLTDIMHEELDGNGVLAENANVELEHFAFLFEFDGDQRHIRHVLYNCVASRPSIEGETNEDSKEVKTDTLNLQATPLANGYVKAKTGTNTTDDVYNKEVTFKASAAVPRLYRIKFGRDIYKDLRQLEKSVGENDEDNSNLDLFSLEMFEDLAWLMARHADPANVPDSPEEFLDQFNTFSIYQILPQLIELWGLNVQTEVESRKNLEKVSGK